MKTIEELLKMEELAAVEFRQIALPCRVADPVGSGLGFLEGYAAVFDKKIRIFGFDEVIRPGAFTRALKEKQDVRALVNHDPNLILGRTKANTLELKEDKKGLFTRVELPDTTLARDTKTSVKRGDLDGMSFAFIVRKQKLSEDEDKPLLREILDVDLFDISVVTYPAFKQTSVKISRTQELEKIEGVILKRNLGFELSKEDLEIAQKFLESLNLKPKYNRLEIKKLRQRLAESSGRKI